MGIIHKESIRLNRVEAIDNKFTVELDFSDGVQKWFKSNRLFVESDQKLDKTDESILSVPALSAVVAVAWAAGADVYLESIDASFLRSLKKVELIFRTWFPRFSFTTEMHVNNVVSNVSSSRRCALLCSGGLDSLASYLKHREQRPTLISVWGADIPTCENTYWNLARRNLEEFATQEGVNIHFVKTNSREIINEKFATRNFLRIGEEWYRTVTHGLILVGSAAPLLANKFESLLVASSQYKYKFEPNGSLLFHYADVSFGGTRVVYDDYESTRLEKVRYILECNPRYFSHLVACNSWRRFSGRPMVLNCCICEKCLRTIAELAIENIDPRCGNFPLEKTESTFKFIEACLQHGVLTSDRSLLGEEWKDIQSNIFTIIGNCRTHYNLIKGSREFFDWFKTFNLGEASCMSNEILRYLLNWWLSAKYNGSKYTASHLLGISNHWIIKSIRRHTRLHTEAQKDQIACVKKSSDSNTAVV